ncbi:hypothetical protein K7432_001455 [Basidiobolus ranarum]
MNHSFFQSETSPRNFDSYLRQTQPNKPRNTGPTSGNFPPGFDPPEDVYTSSSSNVYLDTKGLYSTEASDSRNRGDLRGFNSSANRSNYYEPRNAQKNFAPRNPYYTADSQLTFNPTLPKRDLVYDESARAEVSLLPSNLLENQARSQPPTELSNGQRFSYPRNEYHNATSADNNSRYGNNSVGDHFSRNIESFGRHNGNRYYGGSDESNRTLYQNPRYGDRERRGEASYSDMNFRDDPRLVGNMPRSQKSIAEPYLNDANVGNNNFYGLNQSHQHPYNDPRQDANVRFTGRNTGFTLGSGMGGTGNIDRGYSNRNLDANSRSDDRLHSTSMRHNLQGWNGFGNPMQENSQHRPFQANNSHDMVPRGQMNSYPVAPIANQPRTAGRMGKCTNPELLSLYNPKSFNTAPVNARFFVIKSFTEDDVHKSLKYHIWTSTEMGNRRLDRAYKENCSKGPIYLFFSVNGSGHFCGAAQMLTPLDYSTNSTVWAQNKWKGIFNLKWIFVKDIPNAHLRHILVP